MKFLATDDISVALEFLSQSLATSRMTAGSTA